MATHNTVSIPPELMAQIEAAAQDANQTPDEWAIKAMQKQLEENRWQNMLRRNERYALNMTEEDVPEITHQVRLERRRG